MSEVEVRHLFVGLRYNWDTREKLFFPWNEESLQDIKVGPSEQLYLMEADLAKQVGAVTPVHMSFLRHDNRPALDPRVSLKDHILGGIVSAILQALPTGTFGPDIGPYVGTAVGKRDSGITAFSVPGADRKGHHFKLTIEEISAEEFAQLQRLPRG